MRRTLYLIFFASGATGLVYQVLWLRLTNLVFGNTSYAVATVLAAFMAGLALGNWRLGVYSDKVARPLFLYGVLEVLIGVSAFLVPLLFDAVDNIYWHVAPDIAAVPGAGFSVRFVAAFAIMLVPTFLMGGTLPAMAKVIVRRIDDVESGLGTLYALNTFGAAFGVLVAALYLIPTLGNQMTGLSIAAMNISLGGLAIWLAGRHQSHSDGAQTAAEDAVDTTSKATTTSTDRLVLVTVLISGFVALLYEVAWTRALSALISNSTYAFAIMLVTFLVGIAIGSSWAARYRPSASLRMLAIFQLLIAAGGLVFLVGYLLAPTLLVALIRALYYTFPAVLSIQFAVCASLMILATFFMGATLPIGAQLYSNRMNVLGRRIGNVYSVNTLGAIFGALVAGFVLLPAIGTERTIVVGLFLNAAIALLLCIKASERTMLPRYVAVAMLIISVVAMRGDTFWRPDVLDRGVLIYARQFESRPNLRLDEHYDETDVVFFREGRNATVSVRRGDNYVGLRTNGKVDASNGRDKKTQLLLSYLPGFHKPSAKDVLVIGYGSGITTGAATVFPKTEQIDTVEIEPDVIAAATWFSTYNRRSWEHPRVRLITEDARNFLNVSDASYDLIISEPSNPWIAGMGNLFTAEFYELAAQSLAADGVFAQWLPLYELSPENVRMVLAEIQRQFPEVSVWHMDQADIIVLASRQPLRLDLKSMDELWNSDASVRRDFHAHLELHEPLGLLAHFVTDSDGVRRLATAADRNTDDKPRLEFAAPRNLYARTGNLNIELLNEQKSQLLPAGLSAAARERALLAIIDPLLAMGQLEFASRAVRELAVMPRSAETSLNLAIAGVTIQTTQFRDAEDALRSAATDVGEVDTYAAYREELWARLMVQRGDRSAAIAHYRRAAELDARRPDYLLKIARLHALLREWREAAQSMRRVIESDPYPVAVYWEMLGGYLLTAGDVDAAIDAFETALELDAYSNESRLRLSDIYEQRGDSARAAELLEYLTVYAIDRSPEIYSQLGRIYLTMDDRDNADRVLTKGARIFPTDVAIYKQRQSLNEKF